MKILPLCIFIFLTACSSYKIYQNVDDFEDYNFVEINLPQNLLTINIDVYKVDSIPGIYSKFTNEFFGNIPIISRKSSHFFINNLDISNELVPDTSATFFLKFSNAASRNNIKFHFLDNGLLNINDDNSCYEKEIINKTLRNTNIDDSSSDLFKFFITDQYIEKTDTINQLITIDSIKRIKTLYETKLVPKSDYDIAKDLANDINLLKGYYYDLIGGIPEIAYDDATFNTMIEEIKNLYNFYLSYFIGNVSKTNYHYSINVLPNKNGEENIFLFSFDSLTGFSYDISDKVDNNYYLKITPLNNNPNIENYKISQNTLPARKPMPCQITITNASGKNIIY
ncbi:MAG TPA: DUF4831 family protein, partial [Bacteroidales bacterium]|nr:DUF4831 family protein [Bacteroidales bacterium]